MAGSWGTLGAFSLTGADFDNPANQRRIGIIQLSAAGVGMALGPILTCGRWSDEPHAIPAATFVVGGAVLGLAGATAAFSATSRSNTDGGSYAGILIGAAGSAIGAFAGYGLHLWREPPEPGRLSWVPLVGGGLAGVALGGAF